MGAAVHDRRLLEHDLRHAIARKELRLVYQPLKEIMSGKVLGFEALLRWTHPTRGRVAAEFIPIAEDTGIIIADRGMGAAQGVPRGGDLERSR